MPEYEALVRLKITAADRDEAADLLLAVCPLPTVDGVELVESDVRRADGTEEAYA